MELYRILIRGAGDIASGIGMRLHKAGFAVYMTDLRMPTSVRRTVCFSEAVINGRTRVEDVEAVLAESAAEADEIIAAGAIPVLVDQDGRWLRELRPDAEVDARLAKINLDIKITDAPLVIGVGPGFNAGVDCHAVIETKRGHTLGRVITRGPAIANSGIPGNVCGYTWERVLRAPDTGKFEALAKIGDTVTAGDVVARVNGKDMVANISGIIRGLLPDGIYVTKDMKSGDVDPRSVPEHCYTVSEKALAVGGGVLEAVMRFGVNKKD